MGMEANPDMVAGYWENVELTPCWHSHDDTVHHGIVTAQGAIRRAWRLGRGRYLFSSRTSKVGPWHCWQACSLAQVSRIGGRRRNPAVFTVYQLWWIDLSHTFSTPARAIRKSGSIKYSLIHGRGAGVRRASYNTHEFCSIFYSKLDCLQGLLWKIFLR